MPSNTRCSIVLLLLCLWAFTVSAKLHHSHREAGNSNKSGDETEQRESSQQMAAAGTDSAGAQRVRRHPKSRQHNTREECVLGYKVRIEHHCRYPSMEQPCFQQQTESEWDVEVERAARGCCESGLCSVDDFEELCCRTVDCLAKCYGEDFLKMARRRFRYFDILTRQHPHSAKARREIREGEDEYDDGMEMDETNEEP